MQHRTLVIISAGVLVFVIFIALVGADLLLNNSSTSNAKPDLFVGVDVGYGTENDVYQVANAVSGLCELDYYGFTPGDY